MTFKQATAYDTSGKAQPAQSSMSPAQRFFMVKVTACADYPFADNTSERDCLHDYKTAALAKTRWDENILAITPSCPKWDQSQTENEVAQNIKNLETNPYERI